MPEQILSSEYSDVMQKSYIDYAMSVICSRAVPDVRDGLKPVQRRVLYAMAELGLKADKPHRKSARIVGDTMGKYHPHGDSSIYETLVVMEQEFKKEMPLVDGHGNFGSIEGDGAAAMRYTEARLQKFTQDVYLADLDKDVVDFVPNFDETEKEPSVLPVRVPNVLINGSEGIAVGMTTSIPTHNLGEVIDAMVACMKKKDITTEELMEVLPGPDFPTGGLVVNKSDLKDIYENGVGKIKLRGRIVLEEAKKKADKDKLVITEIPYTMIGQNINKFLADVCGLVENKVTQDIVDISNESSKEGMRIVLELRKGADPEKIKNMLYKKTKLEDTFGVNMLVIVNGKPEVIGVKAILGHCIDFQYEINTRKYTTLLAKDKEQKEIKEGLIKACDIIDVIIEVIRGSKNLSQAKECLINGVTDGIKFKHESAEKVARTLCFTEKQAQAILDLRLAKLIGLEIDLLRNEYDNLVKEIAEFENILSDSNAMKKVIIKDLENIKKEYAVPRKTEICDAEAAVFEAEKPKEQEIVFLMDRFGYAKTIDTASYEKNAAAVDSENRFVIRCMNTDRICIFTQTGVVHQLKLSKLPVKKVKEKGIPIDNLCNYTSKSEDIIQLAALNNLKLCNILFTTKLGMMKFVDGAEFDVSKQTVLSTKLSAGDELISVEMFDVSHLKLYKDISSEDEAPVVISGGADMPEDSDTGVLNVPGGINLSEESVSGEYGSGEAKVPGSTVISSYTEDDDQLVFEFFDLNDGTETTETIDLSEEESGGDIIGSASGGDIIGSVSGGDIIGSAAGSGTLGAAPDDANGNSNSESGAASAKNAGKNEKFFTNKMAVIQTKDGVFLRFKLSEVPEQGKNTQGVHGIKLGNGDEVDKVYIVGFGDRTTIKYKEKDVELMKLKSASRGSKGTKLRV